ncbi:MAG TPA: hypothetical protein VKP30_08855 [Polyangiaceae bacterium]|nr:hypothetical protein [Polyangiaceae bacterium]
MPSIVIRLDPERLQNPDLDLRYMIPDQLAARSSGLIADDGYDYEPENNVMQIYLRTTNLEFAVPLVVEMLETECVLGNILATSAQIGISDAEAVNTNEFRVIYPNHATGVIVPPR